MKFIKLLILPAILALYMLFFMATSVPYKCDADCENTAPRKLTNFSDPAPQLRGIKKQLVKYKRAAGKGP